MHSTLIRIEYFLLHKLLVKHLIVQCNHSTNPVYLSPSIYFRAFLDSLAYCKKFSAIHWRNRVRADWAEIFNISDICVLSASLNSVKSSKTLRCLISSSRIKGLLSAVKPCFVCFIACLLTFSKASATPLIKYSNQEVISASCRP